MKAPRCIELFAQLSQLNQPQRQQVLAALHPAAGLDRVIALIDEIRANGYSRMAALHTRLRPPCFAR